MERTLSIIKPGAVKKSVTGKIISIFEDTGFSIIKLKKVLLTKQEVGDFYDVHKDKPFFQEIVDFMSAGPVVIMELEKEDAILKNREIMGATDPEKAAEGTIRALYGESISTNAVHGSDALETAQKEIAFFFPE